MPAALPRPKDWENLRLYTGNALLVVEDDDDVRSLAIEVFEAVGFTVFGAADGDDALSILREHPAIRILFADVRLPTMSCCDLVQAALALRPALKIVLTTSLAGEQELPPGFPVIWKPYRLRNVVTILQAMSPAPDPAETRRRTPPRRREPTGG